MFRQILMALRSEFDFLNYQGLHRVLRGDVQLERDSLFLTFDDAFLSQKLIADQILDPLGIRALFFVPSRFIDCHSRDAQINYISQGLFAGKLKPSEVGDDLLPMTWEDLGALIERGYGVGSHTMTHPRLSEASDSQVVDEIYGSHDLLTQRLGVPIIDFAYPFGNSTSINPHGLATAMSRYPFVFTGVRGLVSTARGSLPILWRESLAPRFGVRLSTFVCLGGLDWLYARERSRLIDASGVRCP